MSEVAPRRVHDLNGSARSFSYRRDVLYLEHVPRSELLIGLHRAQFCTTIHLLLFVFTFLYGQISVHGFNVSESTINCLTADAAHGTLQLTVMFIRCEGEYFLVGTRPNCAHLERRARTGLCPFLNCTQSLWTRVK